MVSSQWLFGSPLTRDIQVSLVRRASGGKRCNF
jgi:hypothetical protein